MKLGMTGFKGNERERDRERDGQRNREGDVNESLTHHTDEHRRRVSEIELISR